jgi:predicted PurR-regulated permease PerM
VPEGPAGAALSLRAVAHPDGTIYPPAAENADVPQRHTVFLGLLVVLGVATALLLEAVLATVFFAITVAYVLYPLRQWLGRRGVPPRIAAGACTLLAFVVGLALVVPLAGALYLKRGDLFAFFRQLPPTLSVEVAGFVTTFDVYGLLARARDEVTAIAIEVLREAPVIALQTFLFALLLYGLLVWPDRLRAALLRPVPTAYHDVVMRFHRRTRDTLYALYVLQAATAFGTFVVAWLLFWLLGYPEAFSLAVSAGLLQFIPVLGPSILVVGLGAVEVLAGDVTGAILVAVLGLVFVGFAPDAVIRPRLARLTTGMPASLYFVGFVGGVLTVGIVGVIAGPLILALLAECVEVLSDSTASTQQQLN